MINELGAYAYCSEDISKIENYDKALNDKTQIWVCHHRREISENKSSKELKTEGKYYHLNADELIFLTKSQHTTLHNKGKHPSLESRNKNRLAHLNKKPWNKGKKNVYSEEMLQRMSNSHKGQYLSDVYRNKISHSLKGCRHSEESKIKMSKAKKGKPLSEQHKHALKLAWEKRRKKCQSI